MARPSRGDQEPPRHQIRWKTQDLGHIRTPEDMAAGLADLGATFRALGPASVFDSVREAREQLASYHWPWDDAQRVATVRSAMALSGEVAPQVGWIGECLLSLDPNGYTRHEFVMALDRRLGGAELQAVPQDVIHLVLGFLVLRLNDWVPEVRDEARRTFIACLESADLDALASSVVYQRHVRGFTRCDQGDVLEVWRRRLAGSGGEVALRQTFDEGDWNVQREVVATLLHRTDAEWSTWVSRLLASADDVVAHSGIGLALRFLEEAELPRILQRAMEHRAPRIRSYALRTLVSRFPAEPVATSELEKALWDRSRKVRAAAQYHLAARRSRKQLAASYAEALDAPSSPRHHRTAILGLAETGSREDAPRLLKAFQAERGRPAAMALDGYCGLVKADVLDPETVALLRSCAQSADASIRSSAIKWLAPEISHGDEPWMTDQFAFAHDPPADHVRLRQLLRLTRRLRWDDRLRLILTVCTGDLVGSTVRPMEQLVVFADDLRRDARHPGAPTESNAAAIVMGLNRCRSLALDLASGHSRAAEHAIETIERLALTP